MNTEKPLDRAARIVGTQAELARRIGVSKGALNQWKDDGRRIPAEYCPAIERETRAAGEAVTCEEMRPDVAWDVLRMQAAPDERAESATADAQE
ncbi:MAG: Cro/Cl family transcriptional regulator [Caulobacteraceae bacterium]|nr:Cro/Cl family transcriptional regulator [Caulobacteraceae bacterium]